MFFRKKLVPQTSDAQFQEKYPSLSNLIVLLDWNMLSEFDHASPEEAILEDAGDDENWHDIMREGREVLALRDFPWRAVASLNSSTLQTEREVHQWLTHQIALIEALIKIEKRQKEQQRGP